MLCWWILCAISDVKFEHMDKRFTTRVFHCERFIPPFLSNVKSNLQIFFGHHKSILLPRSLLTHGFRIHWCSLWKPDIIRQVTNLVMTNLDSILKSRDITLPTKVHLVKSYGFSCSHEWMWELDYKESWAQKNWCFWTVVLEKALESPLDCKEIQPVHPKGDQSWVFIGRTDVEAEAPILRPPDAKNQLIWKDPDAGKDWGQEEKGTTEDEMVGWHHWLNGHEFE